MNITEMQAKAISELPQVERDVIIATCLYFLILPLAVYLLYYACRLQEKQFFVLFNSCIIIGTVGLMTQNWPAYLDYKLIATVPL